MWRTLFSISALCILAACAGCGSSDTPHGTFVYAIGRQPDIISAYKQNPASGTINQIQGSPFTADPNPARVLVHPSGKFVVVMNSTVGTIQPLSAGTISVYAVQPTGALQRIAGSPFALPNPSDTIPVATDMQIDPSGNFLYVTCDLHSNPALYQVGAKLYIFAIDALTGSLTAVGSLTDTSITTFGFATLAIHPTGKFLYVAEEGNFIQTFSIGTNGMPTTLGSPVANGFRVDSIVMDPAGRFLYSGNQGVDSICCSIPASLTAFAATGTGTLSPLAGSPLFIFPGEIFNHLAMHPSGKFMYSPSVIYTVDSSSGALSFSTVTIPGGPTVVAFDGSGRYAFGVNPPRAFLVVNPPFAGLYVYSIDANTGNPTLVQGSPFNPGAGPVFDASAISLP